MNIEDDLNIVFPCIGILGIEEKEGNSETIEFTLKTNLPRAKEACFF